MTSRAFLNSSHENVHFVFGMEESILLGHIYHMINDDCITGHTVKFNHRSRDQKRANRKRVLCNTY